MDFRRKRRKEIHREKSRFTEAQIVSILKDWDAGAAVAELARKHGVHANTLRLWRAKYGGLEVSDLIKLKQLEEESARSLRRKPSRSMP